jgi:predicted small integral membrane protein
MIDRLSKIVLTAAIACFFSLVVVNNLTDYGTNFAFVQHVLAMDTIYPTSTLSWRAITHPLLQHLVYWGIILWEALIAVLCWVGVWRLSQNISAEASRFHAAKSSVLLGLTASCLLWLVGFFCIAGEWFAMWQSPVWNGQPIGFRMFVMTSLVLLLVRQPDFELQDD